MNIKIIACETVYVEMQGFLPANISCKKMEFGLHMHPERLNEVLWKEVRETSKDVDILILGYGLCSKGVTGLYSDHARIVVPKVHDCIGIFLGSRKESERQLKQDPGSYYLTKGWIECGENPLYVYEKMVERRGEEVARRACKLMMQHYKRVALINTGNYKLDGYVGYAQRMAELYGLRYEEIPGSNTIIKKLLEGEWDKDFIVVDPGQPISYEMFMDHDADIFQPVLELRNEEESA